MAIKMGGRCAVAIKFILRRTKNYQATVISKGDRKFGRGDGENDSKHNNVTHECGLVS